MNYFRILRFLQHGDREAFSVSVEEQQAFLDSLGDANNDIDRGYYQYLSQNFFVPKWKIWTFNILAAMLIPPLLAYYLFKGLFTRECGIIPSIIERKGMDEVIPSVVKERYQPDDSCWHEASSLALGDLSFLLKMVVRAPLHPYFVMKSLMNVSYYSDMIRRHHPDNIIQFGEYSFSSSLLTDYCHRHGVRHIDIMHGEKLYLIRDAYFHYDECYVWDEYYASLFQSLKAEPTQFRIALPPSMQVDTEANYNPKVYADYKYYLALYSENQIKGIVQSMAFVKNKGKTVKYRPHPRYSNMELLKLYVSPEEFELPEDVGIMESISNLTYAVGSYTTVLSQAYFSGKKVILDNITFISQYEKLYSMKYILSSSGSILLSECQD